MRGGEMRGGEMRGSEMRGGEMRGGEMRRPKLDSLPHIWCEHLVVVCFYIIAQGLVLYK